MGYGVREMDKIRELELTIFTSSNLCPLGYCKSSGIGNCRTWARVAYPYVRRVIGDINRAGTF